MAKEKKENEAVLWLQKNPFWACVIVLSTIAVIAGLLLGGVNELTYQSDAEKLAKNLNKAYATDTEWTTLDLSAVNVSANDNVTSITNAYKTINKEGKEVYIYSTTSKGYKSGLELMVVVENNKIINILKTASSETNGAEKKDTLLNQFKNIDITTITGFKNAKTGAGTTDGNAINAITGSTKTSNAVINTIDLVVKYHKAIAGGVK